MCESHGTTFPLLEKSCSVTSDCFIALHMVSCCGTQTAIGLATTSESEFTAAENKCEMAYPGCGCAEGPTTAEDSRNETMGTIQVECRAGACTTFVP
ncbi:MAG TPA: hypothetical protein VL180_02265 [Burkholderiales bacterium]|nr:hypothetical protein [Burkholderiales bacterium]